MHKGNLCANIKVCCLRRTANEVSAKRPARDFDHHPIRRQLYRSGPPLMGQCPNATAGEGFDDTINACLAVSLVISIIGNGFVCFIVARHYQLHTVTNACIVNMAVGQLLLALICVPSFLEILNSSPRHSRWLCSFHRVSFIFFGAVICFAFLLMAVERHVVISTASRRKLTHGKTIKLILSSWVLAAIYAVPWAIMGDSDRHIICERGSDELPSAYLTCMPLLSVLPQTTASLVLNRLSLVLYFLLPMTVTAGTFTLQCKPLWRGFSAVRPLGAGHPRSIRHTAEIKTTRTMLVVATLFIAAWMPYCAVSLRNAFDNTSSSFNGSTYTAALCLAYLSTCFNPLVYALRNPRFSIVMQGSRRRSRKIKAVQFALEGQHRFSSGETQATTIKAHSLMFDTSRSDETQTTSSGDRI